MNLPKTEDTDSTHKNDTNTLSMLLSGQVPHMSNSRHLFWNLKKPVIVQKLCYRMKITYHPFQIGISHKLISMLDVGHILHLNIDKQMSYSEFTH